MVLVIQVFDEKRFCFCYFILLILHNFFPHLVCRVSVMDVKGKKIQTKVMKKTLSPHWDQWFDVTFENLADWSFQLQLLDDKLGLEKGNLGHVIVMSKDWDLCEEQGLEQWMDVCDGLGAVKIGIKPSPHALSVLKQLDAEKKEKIAKEKAAREAQQEKAQAGRPRGRTMLAPPKLGNAAPKLVEQVSKIPNTASEQARLGTAETVGRRPTMEDAMLVQGKLGGNAKRDLFAVFDGHGSDKVAIYCAEHLGEVLLKHLDSGKPPLDALRASFLELAEKVSSFAINMGCTAVAVLLEDGMVHCANCGDTRAVLCSAEGIAERLSLDHKPSLPDETKRIEDLGGFVKNGRVQGQLAVSRALGDANFAPFISPEPYLRSVKVAEEHTHLILACDGLWDVFPDSLACQIVSNQPEPVQAAAMLRDRAFASGSTDNISVLVARVRYVGFKENLCL